MKSQREIVDSLVEAIQLFDPNSPEADDLAPYLYTADSRISKFIEELTELTSQSPLSRNQRQAAGRLMEQIALLAFKGLESATDFKSYQSAGPQHDLLVTGDTMKWIVFCRYLHLDPEHRGILVEAKAVKEKLGDKQFARLCAIIDHNFPAIVGLGVFFTLEGASGFPVRGKRQRGIRDCRLRQVLYYARSNKPVVVLDKGDLLGLGANGSLPRIMARKIRDVSELSGLSTLPGEIAVDTTLLPKHLKELL
jgi:hypothetical protein